MSAFAQRGFDRPDFEPLTDVVGDPFPPGFFEAEDEDPPRAVDPSASWTASEGEGGPWS